MGFLAPALLLGLLALAVPVVIHLIQRERKEAVEFPSLMFLRRIPYRAMRRQKIRHWVLLLIRCAALLLLVLAFARPFFTGSALTADALSAAREVVILLDQSYSMSYGDRWDRARAAAQETVAALGPEDRATVVLFARGAWAGARSTTDRASLGAALEAAEVGVGITRYGPALELAQGLVEQSELPRQEVVLISDFQRVGWEGVEADAVRLPAGAVLTPISVARQGASNVSVSSVSFERDHFSGRERIAMSARLTNQGDVAVDAVTVTLEVDGLELEAQPAQLGPNSSATVGFAPFTLSQPWTRGSVRAGGDALAVDDAFHFVLSPGRAVSVLVIESPQASRDSSLYLSRALSIGRDPGFQIEVRSVDQVTPGDLDGRAVVILNDVAFPPGSTGRRLSAFVEGGGGVLAVLGERSVWPDEHAGLLPGPFAAPIERTGGRGGTLGFIDYSHPVFELFGAPRSGDLSAASFYRYRSLSMEGSDGVLARFDDGGIALAEKRVGPGRVLVWTSTLDSFWNDLALKPVFLPFLHRVAEYLAGYSEPAPWSTVGQVLDMSGTDVAGRGATALAGLDSSEGYEDWVALAPSGRRVPLDGDASGLVELSEQGFYEIRMPDGDQDRPATVAVNLDLSESDLSPLDAQELASAVTGRAAGEAEAAAGPALDPEDQERRQGIWWYLLVMAFLLLAAETFISNRLTWA